MGKARAERARPPVRRARGTRGATTGKRLLANGGSLVNAGQSEGARGVVMIWVAHARGVRAMARGLWHEGRGMRAPTACGKSFGPWARTITAMPAAA